MLPKQQDIEIPLLEVLEAVGGQGKPGVIYPLVTQKFPIITEEDLVETLPSGANKWTNRIQWVRQALISQGEMSSPARGVWAITEKGRQRLKIGLKPPPKPIFKQEIGKYIKDKESLINRHPDMSEADTISTLVEPLLRVLGWDPQALDEVQRQYPVQGRRGVEHVDIALKIDNDVKVFLEAKSIGTALNEPDERQVLNYAYNQGAEWCILTNGRELRVYDPFSGRDIEDRLLFKLMLEDFPNHLEELTLLSRDNIKRGKIRDWGRERQATRAVINWILQNEHEMMDAVRTNVPSLEITKIQEIISKFLRQVKSITL
jgi:predicted type IV restriction endonuclease